MLRIYLNIVKDLFEYKLIIEGGGKGWYIRVKVVGTYLNKW